VTMLPTPGTDPADSTYVGSRACAVSGTGDNITGTDSYTCGSGTMSSNITSYYKTGNCALHGGTCTKSDQTNHVTCNTS
jgi:hypothetical protein